MGELSAGEHSKCEYDERLIHIAGKCQNVCKIEAEAETTRSHLVEMDSCFQILHWDWPGFNT